MFRIKICGITNVEDAIAAIDAGADAIGLNFYERSPRYVDVAVAKAVCRSIAGRAQGIGVFVNLEPLPIECILSLTGLQGVQLHGDEPPATVAYFSKLLQPSLGKSTEELVAELKREGGSATAKTLSMIASDNPAPVIRARRMEDDGVSAIHADLQACIAAGGAPGAILIDSATPGRYGGTGEKVSWIGLADHPRWLGAVRLILAGGLTPDNVAEAIRIVKPYGVDVASGVESAPGKKDPVKVRDFIAAASSALAAS